MSKTLIQESQVVGVDLGLKLQNQHRPFLYRDGDDDNDGGGGGAGGGGGSGGGGGGGGPTSNGYSMMSNIYDIGVPTVVIGQSSSSIHSTATGRVRGSLQQAFDVSYSSANPFFKPSAMGFPFTATQWKELERQAMIYKYMMASLPVPPDLLYSTFPPASFTPSSYLLGKYENGLNLRWSGNSKDAEPGRCRRTDGKKWRCARDVAPNQKYCERHMHRGRPRSRKPVELLHHSLSDFPNNNNINNNNNNNKIKKNSTKKTRLNDPIPQSIGSSIQPSTNASTFEYPMVSGANPFEDSRSLGWTTEEQQWQQLAYTNMIPTVYQHHQFEGEPLNCNFSVKSEMGLLERPLIDAWSMGVTGGTKGSKNSSLSSSTGGNGHGIDEEMCQIHMGLGVIDSWVASTNNNSTPGGPLAEVLRPSPIATDVAGDGELVTPPATAVSSPSGVLQKTLASFSDSSSCNSPTCHNSMAKSEMPFHWLN